jgi:alkylation response protein AidB-like acyl-CoA dehydrogenase
MGRSLIMSRRDLEFLLYEWLDTDKLPSRTRYADHDRGTFDALLDLSERLATDVFAPLNRLVDTEEPRIGDDGKVILPAEVAKALAAYAESGLPTSVFDAELGGMQLPFVVHSACSTWFQAACVGAFAYPFLAEGNASLIVAHGTPQQVRTYAVPVIEGRWYGTMALSEPQAGSSLGDITTRAVRQDTSSARTSCTSCWHAPRRPLPDPEASRCSSCRSTWSGTTAHWASATTSYWSA